MRISRGATGRPRPMAFEQALAAAPADADTHYNHGVALQMRRALPEAARAYRQALALAPDLVAAAFNLGVVHQEERAHDAAIAAYEAVLRCRPEACGGVQEPGRGPVRRRTIRRLARQFPPLRGELPGCAAAGGASARSLPAPGRFRAARSLSRRPAARTNSGARRRIDLVDCLEQLLYLLLFFDVEPDCLRFRAGVRRRREARLRRRRCRARRGGSPGGCASATCRQTCAIM